MALQDIGYFIVFAMFFIFVFIALVLMLGKEDAMDIWVKVFLPILASIAAAYGVQLIAR